MKTLRTQHIQQQQENEVALRTQHRVFACPKRAEIAQKILADHEHQPVYLYRTTYGSHDTPEYKLLFAGEVMDFESDNIIAEVLPTPPKTKKKAS